LIFNQIESKYYLKIMLGIVFLEELYHVITLMGFLQGAILTVLLWRRRQQQGGIFLFMHLLVVSAVMLFPILEENLGLGYTWPLHTAVCFLFQGMFLYVLNFQRQVTRRDWMLHLVFPAVVLIPVTGWVYHGLDRMSQADIEHNLFVTLFSCLKIAVNLGYALATLRLLGRHRRLTHEVYSETSQVELVWVTRLIAGFFAIIAVGALFYFIARLTGWPMRIADMLTYIGLVSYLYYAYLHAVHQLPLIPLSEPEGGETPETPQKGKYQRSTLGPEQAAAIFQKIRDAMAQQQLFRDPNLTLPALADAIGAPTYHISQVLSELAGNNFYDFINGYRIMEAKRLLLDPSKRHYTVLAIAFESGFNSKTTFNKVFRRVTGMTPTEFVAEETVEE
jgi:AraC-like DNA-binding protein